MVEFEKTKGFENFQNHTKVKNVNLEKTKMSNLTPGRTDQKRFFLRNIFFCS